MLELACFSARPQHVGAIGKAGAPPIRALRARFPGLCGLRVARLADGRWLQLGFWDTRERAQAAAEGLHELPEMSDWLARVGEFAEAA